MIKKLNYLAGILSPVTAYAIAALFKTHETTLGFYCMPKVCGQDDLPTWLFFALWGSIYYTYTKIRGERN